MQIVLPPPEAIGLPNRYTHWRHNQAEAIYKIVGNEKRTILSICPTGFGKCLGVDTPVLMFDGSVKPVQDVVVGDWLMGPDSRPREVLTTTNGYGPMFKVTPVKGDPYVVNVDHVLSIKLGSDHEYPSTPTFVEIPVREYLQKSASWKYRAKGYRTGVRFSARQVQIPAYFLGLWLGDGSVKSPSITTMDPEIKHYLEQLAVEFSLTVRSAHKIDNKAETLFLTQGERAGSKTNPILAILRVLGVSNEKHVPDLYKINDRKTRLDLLAGYLDSDGHLNEGCFEFVSKSRRLADDICFVARSLGFSCYITECKTKAQNGTEGRYFRGVISGHTDQIPTKLPHKQASPRLQRKDVLCTGIRVEPCGDGQFFGFSVDGDHRFLLGDFTVTHNSLMYVAAGIILGGKTVILTSTKGLQSQLMRDFEEIGMVDVRGKNAYRCPEANGRVTCDQGMCNFGIACPMRRSGECPYYEAIRRAQASNLVVTNYSFWLYCNKYGEGIGSPKLLVCDEGHDAPEEVASFLTITFKRDDELVQRILPPYPEHVKLFDWRKWSSLALKNAEADLESEITEMRDRGPDEHTIRKIAKLKKLVQELTVLAYMKLENWVCNVTPFEVQFAPIQVADKCQSLLFRDASKALITSGSVNFKTAEMLGIVEDECTTDEYPHSFPVENRLVYHVRGARMNAKTDNESLREWLNTIDRIIADRQDRKGIIHTTSYARRDFVIAHSQFNRYMLSHHRRDLLEMVREFKESAAPRVFVSPSVTTGWDFPYEECEFQILGKVPYPDTRNVITRARCDVDKDYAPYIAMQQIVQACGRGTRSEDDRCENFIIDDNISWFLKQHRKFAPKWFLESVTSRIFPPEPPERIKRVCFPEN